jgi:PAS fold
MHGYQPATVQPTTALVLSHKHPDDAAKVAPLIEAMVVGEGQPFSSTHRIIDTAGRTREVLVIGEPLRDEDGADVGSQGLYVDLSDLGHNATVDAAIADFTAHRSQIEQAKGIHGRLQGLRRARLRHPGLALPGDQHQVAQAGRAGHR